MGRMEIDVPGANGEADFSGFTEKTVSGI